MKWSKSNRYLQTPRFNHAVAHFAIYVEIGSKWYVNYSFYDNAKLNDVIGDYYGHLICERW